MFTPPRSLGSRERLLGSSRCLAMRVLWSSCAATPACSNSSCILRIGICGNLMKIRGYSQYRLGTDSPVRPKVSTLAHTKFQGTGGRQLSVGSDHFRAGICSSREGSRSVIEGCVWRCTWPHLRQFRTASCCQSSQPSPYALQSQTQSRSNTLGSPGGGYVGSTSAAECAPDSSLASSGSAYSEYPGGS